MKLLQSLFKIGLATGWFLILITPGYTQVGNQSDITGPNPGEMPPPNTGGGGGDNGGETPPVSGGGDNGGNNGEGGGIPPENPGDNPPPVSGGGDNGGDNDVGGGIPPENPGDNPPPVSGGGNNGGEIPPVSGGGDGGDNDVGGGIPPENPGDNPPPVSGGGDNGGETPPVSGGDNSNGGQPSTNNPPSTSSPDNNNAPSGVNSGGNNPSDSNQPGVNPNPSNPENTPQNTDNQPTPNAGNSGSGNNTQQGATPGKTETGTNTQRETEPVDGENQQETTQEETEEQNAQQSEEEEKPVAEEEKKPVAGEEKKPAAEEEKKPAQEEEKKEETTDSQPEQANIEVDRSAYDAQIQQADVVEAVQLQEEFQAVEMQNYLNVALFGNNPPPEEIAVSLSQLSQITGKQSALIYVSAVEDEIVTFTVFPNERNVASTSKDRRGKDKLAQKGMLTVQQKISVPRSQLLETVKKFQGEISDEFKVGQQDYLQYSQQLYQWIVAPLESQLKANGIDILVFTMDTGLRGLPIAALHDGKQFLIEKYAVALIPSFGLTDIGYADIRRSPILAMGASQFKDQIPLPAVPVELQTVIENPRRGERFLNEQFTIANFKTQNERERFSIIHLGTHAEFQAGDRDNSYIQFFNNRLSMGQLIQLSDELGWSEASDSPVELLVLSACQTALGDRDAELGFAGLAVAAGVKSVLASLWNVSDLGTLGLMGQFYQDFSQIPNKSEALRQAQLAMLKGEVRVEGGKMILANGEAITLPPEFPEGSLELSHPYYWAAFTMVGNWN